MTGRTLDKKYLLGSLIGEGAMGSVYEAQHQGTLRHVALKLIKKDRLARGKEAARRFRREARAVGSLASPNIVEVLDSGEDAATGDLYLVMERLVGEDLQRLVDRVGALPPDLALRIAGQALIGLASAHAAGIVHRDLKPANIFLAQQPGGGVTVKLLDFGVAKLLPGSGRSRSSTSLTRTGSLLGSPLYMSPEQVESSRDVDRRTDVWSLATVLYCALTGAAPHQDIALLGRLLSAICATPAPALRERAPWVSPEIAGVVHAALALEPAQRTPSAAAMLAAIEPLAPGGFALPQGMLEGILPAERAGGETRSWGEPLDRRQAATELAPLDATSPAETVKLSPAAIEEARRQASLRFRSGRADPAVIASQERREPAPASGTLAIAPADVEALSARSTLPFQGRASSGPETAAGGPATERTRDLSPEQGRATSSTLPFREGLSTLPQPDPSSPTLDLGSAGMVVGEAIASERSLLVGDWLTPGRLASPAVPSFAADSGRPSQPAPPPSSLPVPHSHGATPRPFRRHLAHEDVTALHKAVVDLGLTGSRAALLGGLDQGFVAGLSTDGTPASQLLTDLHALNGIQRLADGSVPLRDWLTNAWHLTSSRMESAIIKRVLDTLAH